jgi:1,4-dihydroxy-6-naphthoate synthase
MQINIGFSTCPNDTFIFDALINKRINTRGLTFVPFMADVEELNQKAFRQELEVSKLSYHAYAYLTHHYILSNSGSALGDHVGPLLISKDKNIDINNHNLRIAIPGNYTTANFIFSLAYPHLKNKREILFSEIENAIIEEQIDLGVVIHETRFTYHERGLNKVEDLGNWWFNKYNTPIPLGAIAINRKLDKELIATLNILIKESVEYAFKNPSASLAFVKEHAQDMREDIIYNHIKLYVNSFTYDLREKGQKAIRTMFKAAIDQGLINNYHEPLFVENN